MFIGKRTCLEIGAGGGFWAKLLKDKGSNVIPTDNFSWIKRGTGKICHTRVVSLDVVSAVRHHREADVLMTIWPYMDEMAESALREFAGNRLIYIGEGEGGCTATDGFFDLLYKEWREVADYDIPQWEGINDRVHMYIRGTN